MTENKRPPTTYINYKEAAEVHIAACKELGRRFNPNSDLYRKNKTERKKIKKEFCYLSGYIVECMVCFALGAILDKENDDEKIHEENISEINKQLRIPGKEGKNQVTFNKFFKEDNHSIERKLFYIREYFEQKNERADIPIIDNSLNFHKDPDLNDRFKALHQSWLPHHRYKLSEKIESILEDDKLLHDYIGFLIDFTNKTRYRFELRT